MEDYLDILIPIIIIGGVFLSALTKRKERRETPKAAVPKYYPKRKKMVEEYDVDELRRAAPSGINRQPRPFINEAPMEEGTSALSETAPMQANEGQEENFRIDDWRGAIITHEILKKKF